MESLRNPYGTPKESLGVPKQILRNLYGIPSKSKDLTSEHFQLLLEVPVMRNRRPERGSLGIPRVAS